ncbi:MAG: hypothetical protein AAGB04_16140 [Pseudomonadota bacterium]
MPKKKSKSQLAAESGLDRDWFSQLAKELYVDRAALKDQMIRFRSSRRISSELRASYPTERGIEMFGEGLPQKHTIDFIMSFLNQAGRLDSDLEARVASTTFSKFGRRVLGQLSDPRKLSISRVLEVEEWRRSDYWRDRQPYVAKMICGTYLMYRESKNMNGDVIEPQTYREILHIKPSSTNHQTLEAFWRRRSVARRITYVGYFVICENFLYGTFVNRSTDEVIKPVNINFLSTHASDDELKRMVYTGSVTGTDFRQEKIIHYPIALKKIDDHLVHRKGEINTDRENIEWASFDTFADRILKDPNIRFDSRNFANFISEKRTEYGEDSMNNLFKRS